jgi:PKHD-type hydroxylase
MIYPFIEGVEDPSNAPALNNTYTQRMANLTNAEIDWIVNYATRLEECRIGIFGPYTDADVKGTGGFFPLDDETRWLYDRMAELCQAINADDFQYDVLGFSEPFYNRLYVAPDDHFEWHVDATSRTGLPRKLTVVLQLSDPADYEGGEFQFQGPRGPYAVKKGKGVVTAFRSDRIHRVTPITKGIRRAMTMFMTGPNFR